MKWISVKEALPPNSELVTVYGKKVNAFSDYAVSEYYEEDQGWWNGCCGCIRVEEITHWIPLPPKPE